MPPIEGATGPRGSIKNGLRVLIAGAGRCDASCVAARSAAYSFARFAMDHYSDLAYGSAYILRSVSSVNFSTAMVRGSVPIVQ